MSNLVSLDEAKVRCRISTTTQDEDADLQEIIDTAEELVLDFVSQRIGDTASTWADTVAGWDEDTVPRRVRAAILITVVDSWRHRGDDDDGSAATAMPTRAMSMLERLRDPALA
jgi:hypothetical protein